MLVVILDAIISVVLKELVVICFKFPFSSLISKSSLILLDIIKPPKFIELPDKYKSFHLLSKLPKL